MVWGVDYEKRGVARGKGDKERGDKGEGDARKITLGAEGVLPRR